MMIDYNPEQGANQKPQNQPIRNNLLGKASNDDSRHDHIPRTNQNSAADLDNSARESGLGRSGQDHLPQITQQRSGKMNVKRTFKPANVNQTDFEGM